MLDETLDILAAAWSGEPVHHRGEHYMVDGMRFLPRPIQRPRIPIWVAGFYGKPRPLRRAARYEGFFPVGVEHPDQLAESSPTSPAARDAARTPGSPSTSSPSPARAPTPRPRGGRRHVVGRRLPVGPAHR